MKASAHATLIVIIVLIYLLNVSFLSPSGISGILLQRWLVGKSSLISVDDVASIPEAISVQNNQLLRGNFQESFPPPKRQSFPSHSSNGKIGKQQNAKKLLTRNFNTPRAIEGMVVPASKTKLVKRSDPAQSIPIYFINLAEHVSRRKSIEAHLDSMKLKYSRVEAVSSLDNVNKKILSIKSDLDPNEKEIACIASHLVALHTAVHDTTGPFADSPFAMIIEDDVKMEFRVNFNELVYNAPADFDVLQLLTSNEEQTKRLYEHYKYTVKDAAAGGGYDGLTADGFKHSMMWERRGVGSNLWSTQAYVVRKESIRDFIDLFVRFNETTQQHHVTVRNTHSVLNGCQKGDLECRYTYPHRLVADIYVYDLLGVGYTSRVPLLNGGGDKQHASGIQASEKHESTKREFVGISEVVRELRGEVGLLPSNLLIRSTLFGP